MSGWDSGTAARFAAPDGVQALCGRQQAALLRRGGWEGAHPHRCGPYALTEVAGPQGLTITYISAALHFNGSKSLATTAKPHGVKAGTRFGTKCAEPVGPLYSRVW